MRFAMLLLWVIPASAATIETSVNCSIRSFDGNAWTTETHTSSSYSLGGTSCAIEQPGSNQDSRRIYATGYVAALDLPTPKSPATPVRARIELGSGAYDIIYPDGREAGEEEATVTISLILPLSTSGPVRPGFIQFSEPLRAAGQMGHGPDRPTTIVGHASVGSISTTCDTFAPDCEHTQLSPVYPFTLGRNFTLHEDATIDSVGFPFSPTQWESGQGYMDLSFILLEADGTTPVQIMDATPEPGTFGTIGLAFCLGAGAFFRRAKFRVKRQD